MNLPIPKKDKSSKDVTPKSTGLKDPNKIKESTKPSGKSKAPLRNKSPAESQKETIEIEYQASDKDSEHGEKTEEHLLEILSDQKNDEESEYSRYSELSESCVE